MASLLPGYEYDIFISYRQKDNRSDQWVTNFVNALREELDATFKAEISIYFDENPHDGLHDHHEVDDSLREKLKCVILIPIVSQTYCDPKSFAWKKEFKVFVEHASDDSIGLKTKLQGGNVSSRVLPVRIHEIDDKDRNLFEGVIGGAMRSIDFIYQETGVNRPLRPRDNRLDNLEKTDYRNQVNKVANAIKDILNSITQSISPENIVSENIAVGSKKVSPKVQGTKSKTRSLLISAKTKKVITNLLLIALFGVLVFFGGRATISAPPVDNQVLRYEIPIDERLSRTGSHALVVSPDGNSVVFVLAEQFFLKQLDQDEPAIPISGTNTNNHRHPFFSPDGNWIGFEDIRKNQIVKVPILGGTPTSICTIDGNARGMNWVGNQIIFTSQGSIYSVPDIGGTPELLYPINSNKPDTTLWNPQLLPDNETLLFNQEVEQLENGQGEGIWSIRTWKLNSKEWPETLVSRGSDVQYLKSGYISYVIDNRLYVSEMNSKGTVGENPKLLTSREIKGYYGRTFQYDFSDNGILVYYPHVESETYHIVWIDKGGVTSRITNNTGQYYSPRLSSDGTNIAVDKYVENSWSLATEIINVKLGTNYHFADSATGPVWSRGNNSIIYHHDSTIFEKPLNLGIPARTLVQNSSWVYPGKLSSDERYYTFTADHKEQGFNPDLWFYDFAYDSLFTLDYYNTPDWEFDPILSPDGKWLLYTSNFSGISELYVVPFPGPGPRYKISANGSEFGIWAPDMSAIYYLENGYESDMWEVKINTEDQFSHEKPVSLFSGHYYNSIRNNVTGTFDIHPDGDKFLMLELDNADIPSGIRVIVNWQQEISNDQ